MFDPKGMAASIVKGEKPDEAAPEETGNSKELAAEDILAAFQENDPKALAAALEAFFEEEESEETPAEEAKE